MARQIRCVGLFTLATSPSLTGKEREMRQPAWEGTALYYISVQRGQYWLFVVQIWSYLKTCISCTNILMPIKEIWEERWLWSWLEGYRGSTLVYLSRNTTALIQNIFIFFSSRFSSQIHNSWISILWAHGEVTIAIKGLTRQYQWGARPRI